jgi:hypothetical protein
VEIEDALVVLREVVDQPMEDTTVQYFRYSLL